MEFNPNIIEYKKIKEEIKLTRNLLYDLYLKKAISEELAERYDEMLREWVKELGFQIWLNDEEWEEI